MTYKSQKCKGANQTHFVAKLNIYAVVAVVVGGEEKEEEEEGGGGRVGRCSNKNTKRTTQCGEKIHKNPTYEGSCIMKKGRGQ